jgi:lipopolysaccharide transport system permease protein
MTAALVRSGLPGALFLHQLFHRHDLLWQMARRDFQRRFVGSIGGWLWALLQPLILLLSWTFVFHVCLKMQVPPEANTSNYTIFLFAGYLPWMLFQETLTRASTALLENTSLITKTLFPSELIPLSVFLSNLFNHALTTAIALAAIAFFDGGISPMFWLIPFVYLPLLSLFATGLAWIVSAFQVYLRDTAQIITVLLTFWFWITPIFIDVASIPPHLQFLPRWNPLALFVQAWRQSLLSWRPPELSSLLFLAIISLAVFLAGGIIFRQLKKGFADVL